MWLTSVTALRRLRLSCPQPCGGNPLRERKCWLLLALSAEGGGGIGEEQHAGLALCSSSGPRLVGPEGPGLEVSAGRDRSLLAPRDGAACSRETPLRGDSSAQPPRWTLQTRGFLWSWPVAPFLGILAPISPSWPKLLRQCSKHGVLEGLFLWECHRQFAPCMFLAAVTRDGKPGVQHGSQSLNSPCQQAGVPPPPLAQGAPSQSASIFTGSSPTRCLSVPVSLIVPRLCPHRPSFLRFPFTGGTVSARFSPSRDTDTHGAFV